VAGRPWSTTEMTDYIDVQRDRYGVEPICRVLQFAQEQTALWSWCYGGRERLWARVRSYDREDGEDQQNRHQGDEQEPIVRSLLSNRRVDTGVALAAGCLAHR
jgi:hypothetical protein